MDIHLFGLTGLVASGKSTVAKIMRIAGLPIIDIDRMLCDILDPGTIVHREILDLFGASLLTPNGFIDTTKLSVMMCKERWIAETVNEIIEDEIDDIIYRISNALTSSGVNVAGIESSKILESKVKSHMEKIVLVKANKDVRINRLISRSKISINTAKNIIEGESDYQKSSKIDFVIRNDRTFSDLEKETNRVLGEVLLSLSELS